MKDFNKRKLFGLGFLILLIIGLAAPQSFDNPVDKSDKNSYNSKSYWYYPWGNQ
jgi:peptidoglycan LD-endopeptidase LytH